MTKFEIILYSFALAFTLVEKFGLKRMKFKPFNCLGCMTGWFALVGGIVYYGWMGIPLLFVGLLIGSLFEAITMRYL